MVEFSQPIAQLDTLSAPLEQPETIEEVLTLAHVFAAPPENLGLNIGPDELPMLAREAVGLNNPANARDAIPATMTMTLEIERSLQLLTVKCR